MRALLVGLLLACSDQAPGQDPDQDQVTHLTDRTIAEAGRTRIVSYRVAESVDHERTLAASVADPEILEIIGAPTVGAGLTIGYVRVLGLETGRTALTVGESKLDVEVVPMRLDRESDRYMPRIVGPSDGATAWGTIGVGVEVRQGEGDLRDITIRLPDGRIVDPIEDSGPRVQPFRQVYFELDLTGHEPGPLELTPVAEDWMGETQPGPPVRIRVIEPAAHTVVSAEAEARHEIDRPQRFADARLQIGRDRDASGGAFFNNAGPYPAMCFPLDVEQDGWYQLMLVASGRAAQGALPTVGIVVDGAAFPTTNARVLTEGWHRIAVGVPIRLESGLRVITPFFENDFFAQNLADRNLYLDRVEVVRVADSRGGDDGSGTMTMMAAGGGDAMMQAELGSLGEIVIDDPYGLEPSPLRIGFTKPIDGQVIAGALEIQGHCWWVGAETEAAPVVTLVLNGEPVAVQTSAAPRFRVDPSQFRPGANTFQLIARLDWGVTASTPIQTMRRPAAAVEPRPAARRHWRFSVHDRGWDPATTQMHRTEHFPRERRTIGFYSPGRATLDLPEEAQGRYLVALELLGTHLDGPPTAGVWLKTDAGVTRLGDLDAPTWWDTRYIEQPFDLPAGPKQIIVSFENDRYEPGRGDRNLFIQSVVLAEAPPDTDETPPQIAVLYPPEGHVGHLADAIVAEVADNAEVSAAELVVDGMPTGLRADLSGRPGRFLLPLLLRSLEPGPHTVAIEAADRTGNTTRSQAVTIVIPESAPVRPGRYDRAVRLLDRFAFGPDPDELAAILTMGEHEWLDDRLSRDLGDAGDLAAMGGAFPYFPGRNDYEVPHRVIAHLLLTPNPARARFVQWSENHFSTWIRKIQGDRKWAEHVDLSRLGATTFDQLLLASAESPAMLVYLDQVLSFAGRINENYARELLELHTMGVDGGYSQEDVTNLAHLLTGWTVSQEGDGRSGGFGARTFTHRFDPRLSDGGGTTVIGLRFDPSPLPDRYDRVRLILEVLATHPSTARFIASKLAGHYVSAPPPEALVDDLSRVFLETGGDMKALLLAIAAHPTFWAGDADRLTHTLDFGVRLCRTTRHFQPWQVGGYMSRSGYGMYDRPTPDGYPEEDAAYSDSNSMIQRWRLATEVKWPLINLVPHGWRTMQGQTDQEWGQLVIDALAVRLTGRVLSETSNEAAHQLLAATPGTRDQRVQALAPVIAQFPEANLR